MSELALGLVAALLAAAFSMTLAHTGSLSIESGVVLAVSLLVFGLLMIRVVRWIEPERRRYLEIIAPTIARLERDPGVLAAEFSARATTEGYALSGSDASLGRLTDFVRNSKDAAAEDPLFLAGAAAYYGEVLRLGLSGNWRTRRRLGFCDVVVVLGEGRQSHDVSPGFVAYSVATDDSFSFDEAWRREVSEL